MASIEELLAAAGTEDMDDELSYVIDEHLRVIAVPERGVVLGVEGDKNVNRVRFAINRYYHGSDFAEFTIHINYENAEGERNYFTVTEKTVDKDQISFIWTVDADAVAYKGSVHFVVNCFTASEDGTVEKAYHTTLGTATVLEGLSVGKDTDSPEIVDFITHLKQDLTLHAGDYVTQAQNAQETAAGSARKALASEQNTAKSEENTKAAEDSTRKMLDQLVTDYTGGCLGVYSVTLPADSWTKADGDNAYSCVATLEASKTSYVPVTAVLPEDIPAGREAVLYGTCETTDGKVRFWADHQPRQDLHVQIALIVPDMELKG